MEHYLGLTLLLISIVPPTLSFQTGAPQAACETLAPDATLHGAQPQPTDIPYVLNLSALYDPATNQMVYTPDTVYNIIFESIAAGPTFRGFLIQARLVADDSTVVGQFEEPPVGGEYQHGFCANTEGSVTHTSRSEKSRIIVPWTAPSNGTGTIHFGYAVVQTRQVYWADQRSSTIEERPCGFPDYFNQQSNSCVSRCPLFTFGNHTTAQCQPFPAVLNQGIQADATAYFGSVLTNATIGTEVFRFRIVIDLSGFNNSLDAIVIIMVRNNLVESIFKFSDGQNQRTFPIGARGGIDAVNASRVFPEITLIENRLVVFEDSVIYQEAPPTTLQLPTTLDFNLNLIVIGKDSIIVQELNFANGTVALMRPPDPCLNVPCQNGGICTANSDQSFSCSCHPAYTGDLCEELIDPCALIPCQNGGTCTNIGQSDYMCDCGVEFTGRDCETAIDHCALLTPNCNNGSCVDGVGTFTCQCDPGFTGDFCDVEINECETAGCQNGQCEDLVNNFRCLCYPGWTGRLCETDIDYCAGDLSPAGPCDDTGAINCNDGNSTYMCTCVFGYTGGNCSEDINECEPNPCQNGGNCTNFLFGVFECECPSGYSGDTCTADLTPCDPQPCLNGGTCNDLGQGLYSCSCVEGFTGQDCNTDLDFCQSDSCLNGGTCIEGVGAETSCNCTTEFTGDQCNMSLMFCTPETCQNGGTCDDSGGLMINCTCTEGYGGMICDQDDPNYIACSSDLCLNGGTCMEEFGPDTSCDCPMGFDGDSCRVDLDFCRSDSCLNGGTCVEGYGTLTSCNCTEGFEGDQCEIDPPSCQPDSCLNGGTCVEGTGTMTTCNCTQGFDGARCENDLPFCQPDTCLNGGTCVEGEGTLTSCNCTSEFAGDRCNMSLMFCDPDTCQNGGTCDDSGGTMITCSCADGYAGMICDQDDPNYTACTTDICLNGGTCMEDFGPNTKCDCLAGFDGNTCEIDLPFCREDSCLNEGTCVEGYGTSTSCNCTDGFDGDRCEDDLDFCQPDSCLNGGTCVEGVGILTSCNCTQGFDGSRCENDLEFCRIDSCFNGGTCIEEYGILTSCNCTDGYNGDRCEDDLDFCQPDSCLNGGTCVEGVGILTSCNCTQGFDGSRCENDLEFCRTDSCFNGGTCVEEYGILTSCNCTNGFDGDRCEDDLDFCQLDSCFNGGTCEEGYGILTTCNCTDGFDGDSCETDLDFCQSDSCSNGGTCVEGVGTAISCNCSQGFDGDTCDNDLPFCQSNTCLNGGTCMEGYGTETTCNCTAEYAGDRCNIALMFCMPETCQNGGTCDDSGGFMISCSCADGYTGMICDQDDSNYTACSSDLCINGGTCVEEFGPATSCDCPMGFDGDSCQIDLPFCSVRQPPCMNGGTCEEGIGTATTCRCPIGYTGINCEEDLNFCANDTCIFGTCEEGPGPDTSCICDLGYTGDSCNVPIPCIPDPCQNGGTCVPQRDSDPIYSCQCPPQYTGYDCETTVGCQQHSDCPSSLFCQIDCPSDRYPPHSTLLVEAASLSGTSFVSVPQSRYPDFSGDVSIFAVFRQDPGNQGYLFFYGTSPDDRNLAVFLDAADATPRIFLFYTSRDGSTKSVNVQANIADNAVHYLAITVDVTAGSARFFLDGFQVNSTRQLMSPNLTALITESNQPSLFVGARLVRHYRFAGEIMDVVVFNSLISASFVAQLQSDYSQVSDPVGQCVSYLSRDQQCPSPLVSTSLLCQSVSQVCDPTLRCLPTIGGTYTCQPQPIECSSDSDCMPDYFCGSPLPAYGKNYYDNPGGAIPGQVMFLQQNAMGFDGTSVISLPTTSNPPLSTDLTIFATVCQDVGNDGYVVGKGINDRMRDFGLYLRSTKQTVWLAYGADGATPGFREILFFYNVTVADGACHSVAAVIDSASNRAVLYIDGEPVGIRAPLPSVPEFRPFNNLLYVGGRPSTRLFRFSGNISNLFVGSGALSLGNIVNLHRQAFANGGINPISTDEGSVRYCYPYQRAFEQCYVNSFANNDFRCQAPAECVPLFSASGIIGLPVSNTNNPLRLLGRCVEPCSQDCSFGAQDLQCGTDGHTYYNTCFRNCANIQFLHDGQCTDYAQLYASTQS